METHITFHHNGDLAALRDAEPTMLADVLKWIGNRLGAYTVFDVFVGTRVPADAPPHRIQGWLEWNIHARTSFIAPTFVVGAIQREVGAQTEFHS